MSAFEWETNATDTVQFVTVVRRNAKHEMKTWESKERKFFLKE